MGKNIVAQKRGKGSPTYRANSFRFKGTARIEEKQAAEVLDFINCRAHSAPLAELRYKDGSFGLMIASEGLRIGDAIAIGPGSELKIGNVLPLKEVPEGIPIYNIEAKPGDGGKFVRGSGSSARIVTKTKKKVIIKMPSKKRKTFNPKCKAIVGVVAGGGRKEKPFLKAGTKFYYMKKKNKYWPKTSGSAMNAVDHPFGNKRSSRKSKARPAPRNAPPGRKIGMIKPKRTGRKKGVAK